MMFYTLCVKCGCVICLQDRCKYPHCMIRDADPCKRLQVEGKDFDVCEKCMQEIVQASKEARLRRS